MKLHRVTVYIVDHDELGANDVKVEMENVRYPNHCISPRITSVETVDIGEWSDDHPANRLSCELSEYFKAE